MADSTPDLERIQRWFHAAITHPGGARKGLASDLARQCLPGTVGDVVLPSSALDSRQRLSIYANMYFDRLIEVLGDEFPTVRHLTGVDRFAEIVKAYVTEHPSTHYSLAKLGEKFPRYLLQADDALDVPHRRFAAAVATVERTMEDVFDERRDEPLVLEDIEGIPPDSWGDLRLRTVSALRLLTLPYPVNATISAVRDGRDVDIPARERSFVVVYRRDYRVWRKDLSKAQYTLLSALHEGQTLSGAVRAAAELPGSDSTALAASLNEWFRDWTAEGFFYSVTTTPDHGRAR